MFFYNKKYIFLNSYLMFIATYLQKWELLKNNTYIHVTHQNTRKVTNGKSLLLLLLLLTLLFDNITS